MALVIMILVMVMPMMTVVFVKFVGIFQTGRKGLAPLPCLVDDKPCHHREKEKYQEKPRRLAGEQGKHHERLVTRRGNHHCHKGPETDHPVGIERNGGESADAARNRSEQGGNGHLSEA